MHLFRLIAVGIGSAGWLGLGLPAEAGAFKLDGHSARGLGRAFSGEVADRGAASLFWNPASIARSGGELYVGGQGLFSSATLSDSGSTITRPSLTGPLTTPVGGQARLSDALADLATPDAALVVPIGGRGALGVSVSRPFALDTELGEGSWPRYDTLRAKITSVGIQGVGAVRVNDWLDLGVGVDAQHMDALLEIALPNLSPLLPDGKTSVAGAGWNYGWNVGAVAELGSVTLGASYKSKIGRQLAGTFSISGLLSPLDAANGSFASSTEFDTPWTASLGARWRATPQLTLNAQATRHGWKRYDDIRIVAAGQTTAVPQKYRNTTSIAVGADFEPVKSWVVRAGVQFDPTPTPVDLREAGVPDADTWLFAAGTSFQAAPGISLDAGAGYRTFLQSDVFHDVTNYAGSPAQTLARVRGGIDRHEVVLSAGMRWAF